MADNEELTKKIIGGIKKSGFPSELLAANLFFQNGWENVDLNHYYLDLDEEKGREIDLIAFHSSSSPEHNVYVRLHLIAAVKKSTKPWVVFSTQSMDSGPPGWSRMFQSDEISKVLSYEDLERKSSLRHFKRYGHSYIEALNGKSAIFEALITAVKASEYRLRCDMELIKEEEEGRGGSVKVLRSIDFYEPMVIVDGSLYEAYLDNRGELQVKKIDHIPVSLGYLSPNYQRNALFGGYVVEIVTMEGLRDVILLKDKWLNDIKNTLVKFYRGHKRLRNMKRPYS